MKPLILPPWIAPARAPGPPPRLRPQAPRRAGAALPDSEREPMSFFDTLDGQEWLRAILWSALAVVLMWAIVSFFSAPLMGLDVVIVSGLVTALLVTAYAF